MKATKKAIKRTNDQASINAELATYEEMITGENMSAVEQKRVNQECLTSPYSEQSHLESEVERKRSYFLSFDALASNRFNNITIKHQPAGKFFNVMRKDEKFIHFYAADGIEVTMASGLKFDDMVTGLHFNDVSIEYSRKENWATLSSKDRTMCMISSRGHKLLGFTEDEALAFIPSSDRITTEW